MKKAKIGGEKNVVGAGIALAATYWILDAMITSFGAQGQPFFSGLVSPDPIDALRRFLNLGVFLVFVGMMQSALPKIRRRNGAPHGQNTQFLKIFDRASDAVFIFDPAQDKVFTNPKANVLLGFDPDALRARKISEIHAEDAQKVEAFLQSVLENGSSLSDKLCFKNNEGKAVPLEVSASSLVIDGCNFVIARLRNTAEHQNDEGFDHLSNTIFKNASEGIVVVDAAGGILSANPTFSRITGYSLQELLGQNTRILKSGKHDKKFYEDMWREIKATGQWTGEIWNRRKNGEIYPSRLAVTAIQHAQGSHVQYIGLYSDMTVHKQAEEKFHFQTHHDPLTGLPNRTLALEHLSQIIKQVRRTHSRAALLLVDLNRFKQVNDTFGHTGGDEILQQVAHRLVHCVRESDTVARTGGDEFIVILTNSNRREGPSIVAKKIIKKMALPFFIQGQEVFLGASIGITMSPDDGDEVLALLRNADIALTKAKTEGSNRFRLFSGDMEKEAKSRALLEWDLRRAIEHAEFVVYYQPVLNLNTLETVALEALIRWKHPDKGILPPGAFIALAEESELIKEIGRWILKTACNQVQQWRDRNGYKGAINVNVSTRQMVFNDFRSVIVEALNQSCLPPECLTLEVTESLMMDPKEDPIAKLRELKDIGVKLAIDDFGTGYSSLSYLWRYPIDYLKIDKSFIFNIESDKNKQHLVAAIVRMGQSMKMKVIAEGVETKEDLLWLIDFECDAAQGYYFSKPVPAEKMESILAESAGRPCFQTQSLPTTS